MARKARKQPVVTGDPKPSKEAISGDDGGVPKDFPVGMRVLVVDDNPTCLAVVKQMLGQCRYKVKTCSEAKTALTLLEKNEGEFDIVLSDVHMPDMDGLKLLELVGLQMDLPVIMMSVDGDIDTVMKGIRHGARDYLIKPVRMEALRNLWQHVLRQKLHSGKENSSSLEDPDHRDSLQNEKSEGSSKSCTKRRNPTENDDSESDDEDPYSKKPRMSWTPELHYQFVSAVQQLGSASAKPKKILELMNAPGLTRSNVSSHLQKFRKYLAKINEIKDPNTGLDSSAVSALLGQPSDNFAVPAMDQTVLQQLSVHGPGLIPVERRIAFGKPLMNCQTNISKKFSFGGVNSQISSIVPQAVQKQQTHPFPLETHHAISPQPLCVIVPNQLPNNFCIEGNRALMNQNSMIALSQSFPGFQAANNPSRMNQNSMLVPSHLPSNFQALNAPVSNDPNSNCKSVSPNLDFGLFSAPPNKISMDMGQGVMEDFNNYSILGQTSSSVPSFINRSTNWQVQTSDVNLDRFSSFPRLLSNSYNMHDSQAQVGTSLDQGPETNIGFTGKGACIRSRTAMDDTESPNNNIDQHMSGDGKSEGSSAFGFYGHL